MKSLTCLIVIGAASSLFLCGSAQALPTPYTVTLSGPAESPSNTSPGTGSGLVVFDSTAHTLYVHVDFSGLVGNTTASHIHGPTAVAGAGNAGVATSVPTFTGFPLGVTSGTYDHTFDLTLASSWNPAFITAHGGTPATAEVDFGTALADGKAYLNIHTTAFPGGEIRGFLTPSSVPDISTTAPMMLLAVGPLLVFARRGRS
jgi:hypothetical protein